MTGPSMGRTTVTEPSDMDGTHEPSAFSLLPQQRRTVWCVGSLVYQESTTKHNGTKGVGGGPNGSVYGVACDERCYLDFHRHLAASPAAASATGLCDSLAVHVLLSFLPSFLPSLSHSLFSWNHWFSACIFFKERALTCFHDHAPVL